MTADGAPADGALAGADLRAEARKRKAARSAKAERVGEPVAIVARFAAPATPASSGDDYHTLDQTGASATRLAVHFRLAMVQHASLIMLDAATGTRSLSAVTVTLATESGESVDYYQWPSVPASVAQVSPGASDSAFAQDTADTGWDTGVSLGSGSSIELPGLVIDQDPVLIRTTQRLQVIWP